MARFKLAYFWPPTGHPDGLHDPGVGQPTPVKDAFVRSSRSACWLYTEALQQINEDARRSALRITAWFPEDLPDRALEPDSVALDLYGVMLDMPQLEVRAGMPPDIGRLGSRDRARLALEIVHVSVLGVAEIMGWEPPQFEACRDHVLTHDFEYCWSGAWKSSPDRRHGARASFSMGPEDGFGRVRLEVAGRDGVVLASEEAVAYSTMKGFTRAAGTLHWNSRDEVTLTPYSPLLGPDSGEVTGRLLSGGWTFQVRDDVTVRQPHGWRLDPGPDGQPLPRVLVT